MVDFINTLMRRRLVTTRTCALAFAGCRHGMKIDVPGRNFRQLISYLTPSTSIGVTRILCLSVSDADQFIHVEEAPC